MEWVPAIAAAVGAAASTSAAIYSAVSTPKLKAPDTTPTAQENALLAGAANTRQRGFASTLLSRDFMSSGNPALKSTLGS